MERLLEKCGNLVVENDVEQRTVDLQSALDPAGVLNETQFSESVHEEAYSRTRGSNHVCKRFLAYFGNNSLGHTFLAEMSQQQENAGQPLFTGIKQLVNQIFLIADIPRQQIRDEQVGK